MVNKVSYLIRIKDQFSSTAKNIGRSFKHIEEKAKSASLRVKQFVTDTEKLKKLSKKMAVAGGVMTAAVTAPFLSMANKMINAASDAEETANKFKEVFKGIDTQSAAATKRLASGFDLADSTVQELLANTGDLLTGLGMNAEQALKLSESVVSLSSDVASFKNVEGGAARAANALTKALLGEREMLKDTFKTAVLESEVKKRALIVKRKDRKLTDQQAKAIATLLIVTERNNAALGDYNRTREAYANLSRRSEESTKRLSESFGKLLLPYAVKIKETLTSVVDAINGLSPVTKSVIMVIAGLIAVIGPLLLLLAGVVFIAATVTAGMVGIAAGVALAIAGIAALAIYWGDITKWMAEKWFNFNDAVGGTIAEIINRFESAWSTIKSGFVSFINFVIEGINKLVSPLNFLANKFGMGDLTIAPIAATKTTPVNNQSINLNGQIDVSASGGAKVEKTKLKTDAQGMNVGLNMVGAS